MKTDDISRLRLVAQHVVGPALAGPAQAARWMTATQAQDFNSACSALAIRSGGRSLARVIAALNDGSLVRSWTMRGTLHFVHADDLKWMLSLTAPPTARAHRNIRYSNGVDDEALLRASAVTSKLLAGSGGLTRRNLIREWEKRGIHTAGSRGYHTMTALAWDGLIALGPMDGPDQKVVLIDELHLPLPAISREEKVAQWAIRYFLSHGPATLKDFLWWSKLLVRDVKPLIGHIRENVETGFVGDTEYFFDTDIHDRARQLRRQTTKTLFLPGFDEMILGYHDRSPTLPAAHASKVAPSGNGVFAPVVLSRGRAVARWKETPRENVPFLVEPFDQKPDIGTPALERAHRTFPKNS